jgi:hypothetical protein
MEAPHGIQPLVRMSLLPTVSLSQSRLMVRIVPAVSPLRWGSKWCLHPRLVVITVTLSQGNRRSHRPPVRVDELRPTSGTHHQATLENSVCSKHPGPRPPLNRGPTFRNEDECSSMALHSIDRIQVPAGPAPLQWVAPSNGVSLWGLAQSVGYQTHPQSPFLHPRGCPCGAVWWLHHSASLGANPENVGLCPGLQGAVRGWFHDLPPASFGLCPMHSP